MSSILLFLLSTVCVFIPYYAAKRHGVVPWVSPLHIVAYMAFFGIFLKTVYLEVFRGEMFFHRFASTDEDVVLGYIYLVLFIICITVGYVMSVRRVGFIEMVQAARVSVVRIQNRSILVLLVAVVSLLVVGHMLSIRGLEGLTLESIDALNSSRMVRIEGVEEFGASYTAVKMFLFLPTMAFVIFLARYILGRKRSDLNWTLAFFALELFLTVLEGKRFGLVLIVMNAAIIPILLGRRVSPKFLIRGIIAIAFVLVLYVVMTSFRMSQSETEEVQFDVSPAIEQIFGSTYFLDINMPIVLLSRTGVDDLFWGSSYFYWTYAWIPRQLWPNKPAVTLGPYVKREVLGLRYGIGGINPTGPGEAILNFGWLGILVGLGIGFVYRKCEELTLSKSGLLRRGGLWVYPILVVPLVFGTLQSSFSAVLTPTLFTYLFMRLVLTRLNSKRRPESHPMSQDARRVSRRSLRL